MSIGSDKLNGIAIGKIGMSFPSTFNSEHFCIRLLPATENQFIGVTESGETINKSQYYKNNVIGIKTQTLAS